jgi:hypothetical protein
VTDAYDLPSGTRPPARCSSPDFRPQSSTSGSPDVTESRESVTSRPFDSLNPPYRTMCCTVCNHSHHGAFDFCRWPADEEQNHFAKAGKPFRMCGCSR